MAGPNRRRRGRDTHERDQLVAALRELSRPEPKPRRGARGARTARAVVWRQRRPLAPLAVIAALYVAGLVVDRSGVSAATVALLGGVTAWVVWRMRYAPRLDRAAERRYAKVCLAAAVVWLVLVAAGGMS